METIHFSYEGQTSKDLLSRHWAHSKLTSFKFCRSWWLFQDIDWKMIWNPGEAWNDSNVSGCMANIYGICLLNAPLWSKPLQ